MSKSFWSTLILVFMSLAVAAQDEVIPYFEYDTPKDYEIAGVTVVGAEYADPVAIKSITGLQEGKVIKVPGADLANAVKALWKLRLFTDVQIIQEQVIDNNIFLKILVRELPRLNKYSYKGAKKSHHEDLNEQVKQFATKGGIVTDDVKNNTTNAIENYYVKKGFLDAKVKVNEFVDTIQKNTVNLQYAVEMGEKVKIADITFAGNKNVIDRKLKKQLADTKSKKRIFAKSALVEKSYKMDKESMIAYYNTLGYRDAKILKDSIWRNEKGDVRIHMDVEEGNQYYFGDIVWKGNSLHDDETLNRRFGIQKGDVYNPQLLSTRLDFSEDGRDVSSLYMNDGYLFFSITPVETSITNDSIDFEMRMYEGPQATINKVVIQGNDKTHEHVVRRELRTKPGQKFSREDIIRSQREIMNLGYFNPENMDIQTPVDPQNGTVDIEYTLEERPSDQLELSAGWGGIGRNKVIGTLGVTFNNFAISNAFNKKAWRPVPQGDGQKLSIRAQTNGDLYQSLNFSFTEPWLGGKKPNSLTVGGVYSAFDYSLYGTGKLSIGRLFAGLGTRLRWPDDFFISNSTVNLERILLDNYTTNDFEGVSNGTFYNLNFQQIIARNSINEPIFPRSGSKVSLTMQFTPPYSLFNDKDYSDMPPQEKFKFVEYHKWRFDTEWYTTLVDKLVLKVGAKMGMIGFYNEEIGIPPFERFQLGGDGLSNQQFGITGKDILALRGYEFEELPASNGGGASVFNKFTVELRYPLSLNPSSTIFVLGFLEGGNAWEGFRNYNPFDLRRSAGMGVRIFLPMFGLLGFDYGFGFDKPNVLENPSSKWQDFGKVSIILGFEPD